MISGRRLVAIGFIKKENGRVVAGSTRYSLADYRPGEELAKQLARKKSPHEVATD